MLEDLWHHRRKTTHDLRTTGYDRIDRSQDFKHTVEPPCDQKWSYDNPKIVGKCVQDLSTIICDLKRIEVVSCHNLSYHIV